MNAKNCGAFISALRKEKNLSQKELAEKLNVTDKAISRWETGKGYPDIESLENLSEFFEISINELLAGEKADIKSIEEIAESNIITAITETEKIQKSKKTTIIISVIIALIVLLPLINGSIKSLVELLSKYTLIEDPWVIILLLFIALCVLFAGLTIYKGHYQILHKYHYKNVTDFDGFCKELGKEIMFLSLPLFITTILELWASLEIIALLSSLILGLGLLICFAFIFKTIIKYNGSLM